EGDCRGKLGKPLTADETGTWAAVFFREGEHRMPRTERRRDERPELAPRQVNERVASRPDGDERALQEARTGVDADIDNQSDAVARETPGDALKRLSDPRPQTSVLGLDDKVGSENAGKNEGLGK